MHVAGLETVTVIHGIGTGEKNEYKKYLKT